MKLSIIVCTRNRAYAIAACLDSIAASLSRAAPVEAEIVVVDNASTDDTSAVVKKWSESCAFPVQLLHEPRKGLARARNCALRGARGDLLVFTDDDCRLSEEFVQDALRHDAGDAGLVIRGGRVELGDPKDLPFSIKTDKVVQRCHKELYPVNGRELGAAIIGANMTMRRALVDRLGFFDERFGAGGPFHGGEEVDYVYRAYLSGILVEYVPDLLVLHFHGRNTLEAARKLVCNYNIGDGALYAKFIFKANRLARPLWWDIKRIIPELLGGPYFLTELNISHRTRVASVLRGMIGFYVLSIRNYIDKK